MRLPRSPARTVQTSVCDLVVDYGQAMAWVNRSEKQWKMPPREWSMAKAQFAVLFGERFTQAMA